MASEDAARDSDRADDDSDDDDELAQNRFKTRQNRDDVTASGRKENKMAEGEVNTNSTRYFNQVAKVDQSLGEESEDESGSEMEQSDGGSDDGSGSDDEEEEDDEGDISGEEEGSDEDDQSNVKKPRHKPSDVQEGRTLFLRFVKISLTSYNSADVP